MKTITFKKHKQTLNDNLIIGEFALVGQFNNQLNNFKMNYVIMDLESMQNHIIELGKYEEFREKF